MAAGHDGEKDWGMECAMERKAPASAVSAAEKADSASKVDPASADPAVETAAALAARSAQVDGKRCARRRRGLSATALGIAFYLVVFAASALLVGGGVVDYAALVAFPGCVRVLDAQASHGVLLGVMACCFAGGLACSLRSGEDWGFNALMAAAAAGGLYWLPYLILCNSWTSRLCLAILAVGLVVGVAHVLLRFKGRWACGFGQLFRLVRWIAVAVAVASYLGFCVIVSLGIPYAQGEVRDVAPSERTLEANFDSVLFAISSDWDEASFAEKTACLQAMCRVEANYLHVDEPVVRIAPLEQGRAACLRDGFVCVNVAYLVEDGTGLDAFESLAHEMAHCFQHAVAEDASLAKSVDEFDIDDRTIEAWTAWFGCRSSWQDDACDDQDIERFARAYANASMADTIDRIIQYLETGSAGRGV